MCEAKFEVASNGSSMQGPGWLWPSDTRVTARRSVTRWPWRTAMHSLAQSKES